jgi:hypothetical protein
MPIILVAVFPSPLKQMPQWHVDQTTAVSFHILSNSADTSQSAAGVHGRPVMAASRHNGERPQGRPSNRCGILSWLLNVAARSGFSWLVTSHWRPAVKSQTEPNNSRELFY